MGRQKKKGDHISGWVNVDKPLGMTSTQAVGKVRRIMNAQKVGHAGTLDPLATGILPIALGEATKTIPYAQDADKTYEFEITWGQQRSTDDAEGETIDQSDKRPSKEEIEKLLPRFIGEIEQTPPQFSAIKIDGERAYDLARDGQKVEIKSRIITIHALKVLETTKDTATLKVHCGKGTYVRAIARDLGILLGCYGYVSALRRTQVGVFDTKTTISLDKLEPLDYKSARSVGLLPLQTVLDDIPALVLTAEETADLRNGRALSFVSKPDFLRITNARLQDNETALALFQNNPIALVIREKATVKPVRVFNI